MKKLNNNPEKVWKAIANNYVNERATVSFAAILIDSFILDLIDDSRIDSRILDFGAGNGVLTKKIVDQGFKNVDAYEPVKPMRDALITNKSEYQINVLSSIDEVLKESYDIVIQVNVIDHILDVNQMLQEIQKILVKNGRFIVCIPHPLKNIGNWVKSYHNGVWSYDYYKLEGYLNEGEVSRTRENIDGDLIIENVVSQHRTIATYYNCLVDNGFTVNRMLEPAPKESHKLTHPILYKKSSGIPYFWILDCNKV